MKKGIFSLIGILFLALSMTSCLKDQCEEVRTFIQYNPQYRSMDEIRINTFTDGPRDLENPGKLYVYQQYLFINEKEEGVHIYDNSDPANPTSVGFIAIPGNVDIAVKDGYMYADNYMDLLTIDINNPLEAQLICRDEDVFTQYWLQEGRGILIGYEETEQRLEVDCTDPNFNNDFFIQDDIAFGTPDFDASNVRGGAESSTGTGGSLARFTIAKDHLYAINDWTLFIFDVESAEKPRRVSDFYVEWGIETLFPQGDNLFIGARNGMHIYSIEKPGSPQYMSVFRHATACDPVYVEGDIAYVTLRDGQDCETFSNQLDVIDVKDLRDPQLIASFEMDHPHGLSVRNDRLYLCEGEHGLKIFDTANPETVGNERTNHIEGLHAYDAIALGDDHLLVIGADGLYQYDISDRDNPVELSVISPVN